MKLSSLPENLWPPPWSGGVGPDNPAPPDVNLKGAAVMPQRVPIFADINLCIYRIFITTTGGKDASDKYHKQTEKSPEPDRPASSGPEIA
jgi:hypothetical protein